MPAVLRRPAVLLALAALAAALTALALAMPAGSAPSAELKFSTAADRSTPQTLDGATVDGNIYVFTLPETGVTSVKFWLDNTAMTGTPTKIEGAAPYDFVGTAKNGTALPFGTKTLANGQHTISVQVAFSDGTTQSITGTFTVDNQPPQARLMVSASPDRSNPQPLDGATVQKNIYVFSLPEADVTEVKFWLDDPAMVGTPKKIEAGAPFDYAGSASNGTANPLATKAMANGQHTITAAVTYAGGLSQVVTATFTVDNHRDCSPLTCGELLVDVPYSLTFDRDHGKIVDANGIGTGFTAIDPPTNGTGYIPANIVADNGEGTLQVTTTNGLMFTGSNSQANALSVGIDAPNQITNVNTVILNPPAGTGNFEQAGVWFGNDEDNYDKIGVISTPTGMKIEHVQEVKGRQTFSRQSAVIDLAGAAVTLNLKADPFTRNVSGSYRINGGPPKVIGEFIAPGEFFSFDAAGIDPQIGTRSFGGIFASHRNGPAPLTYSFAEFNVGKEASQSTTTPDVIFDRASFPVPFPTSMAYGPDGRLYVTELFGKIHKITLDQNGMAVSDQVITTLGTRLTLGVTIDPASTPGDVIVWATHSSPSLDDGVPNSGIVSRLSGPSLGTRADVITGIPRAKANHGTNSIHFGPDGKLYIAQGGNTGAGAPNEANTEFGTMAEQPLSAALLVAEVKNAGFDGSCNNPVDIFGPPPCDVQVFASGMRNTYDFVFHSNGSIYGADNGLGVTGTFPPSPTPPCGGFGSPTIYTQGGHNPGEQPDTLNRLQPGKYYGHPNPTRNECVYRDGSYQGVPAPANYVPPVHSLGNNRSANGMLEYRSNAFCATVRGELLIANYSVGDNISRNRLSADGASVTASSSLVGGFTDPLPIVEGPNGRLFVGEFGAGRVTVLTPVNMGCWGSAAPLPLSLLDAGGTALGGKLYVVGGKSTPSTYHSTPRIYDPVSNTWSTGPNLPGPAVENPAVVVHGGKLYAFAGSTDPFTGSVRNAAVYDPATNAWTPLPPMATGRGGATAQSIGGKIYVIGGMDNGASLASVEVFDPSTGTWSAGPTMGTRRDNAGSAVLNGKLYVFGGRTRNADGTTLNGALDSTEVLDPAGGGWTAGPAMPTGRRTMTVGLLGDKAQVMGGEGATGSPGTFPQNEQFDPDTNTWRTLKAVLTPRHGAVAGTIGGVVYVVGGGAISGSSFTDLNETFTFENPN
jgi:glucose/arabinose dehydrogenase/N-acetylneuraminic acid mutarotase